MEKIKGKTIYLAKFHNNNVLEDQLDWSNKFLNCNSLYKNSSKTVYLRQGDVYEFKFSKNKTTLGIILSDSNEYQSKVLICPIYIVKDDNLHDGLEIGLIPEISTKYDFIAAVQDIRFVSVQFLFFKESNYNPVSLARIMKSKLIDIVYLYKSLIETIIKIPKKFEDIHIC